MTKTMLSSLVTLLFPACLWAVDGQILINQSTVMAAGGFPYTITQPGSYKLSGNLTVPVIVASSIGIQINVPNVTIDLNGFSIITSFRGRYGIAGAPGGTISSVTVRNGYIIGFEGPVGQTAQSWTVQDLSFSSPDPGAGIYEVNFASYSIIQHVTAPGYSISVDCPTLVSENTVFTVGASSVGTGCVFVNNAVVVPPQ